MSSATGRSSSASCSNQSLVLLITLPEHEVSSVLSNLFIGGSVDNLLLIARPFCGGHLHCDAIRSTCVIAETTGRCQIRWNHGYTQLPDTQIL